MASCAFVKDLTIPDGSLHETGSTLKKTWIIKNNSSSEAWPQGCELAFDSGGVKPAHSYAVQLGRTAPGAEVEVSVDVIVPSSPG